MAFAFMDNGLEFLYLLLEGWLHIADLLFLWLGSHLLFFHSTIEFFSVHSANSSSALLTLFHLHNRIIYFFYWLTSFPASVAHIYIQSLHRTAPSSLTILKHLLRARFASTPHATLSFQKPSSVVIILLLTEVTLFLNYIS